MWIRIAGAAAAVLTIAGFVVLATQASGLASDVESQEEQLVDQAAAFESENADLKSEIEDLRAELGSVGATSGVEKMKTQLVNLKTCFAETLAAVQGASVQGWVSNYQSGDVEGWLDLGRFSTDCEPFLPSYEGD